MPWKTKSVQTQRTEIVGLALVEGANKADLCRRFGISRKTLYKWLEVGSSGVDLTDRSCRPLSSPRQTPADVEAAVVALREQTRWGGRKISRRLADIGGPKVCPSTVTEILRRHGLLDGPRAGAKRDWQRFEREYPNELWQMDFKGHFPMLCGDRCHPFTCLDDHSRFCISLAACQDERSETVQERLSRAFEVYGLPNSILCDNGGCWGASSGRGLTPVAVWMSQLGIKILHGKPYHPQTQGKQERFHKSLVYETLSGRGFANLGQCQHNFDVFRARYNLERPHESIGLKTPASIYRCSPRPFIEGPLPEPEYPPEFTLRKVQDGGILHYQAQEYRVGKCLKGHWVGVRPFKEDGVFEVCYARTRITIIDLRKTKEPS